MWRTSVTAKVTEPRNCSGKTKQTHGKIKLILFQNHPQRYEKPVSYYSDTAIDQRKIRSVEKFEWDLNLNWIRLAANPR
jgi:hypothetical protein